MRVLNSYRTHWWGSRSILMSSPGSPFFPRFWGFPNVIQMNEAWIPEIVVLALSVTTGTKAKRKHTHKKTPKLEGWGDTVGLGNFYVPHRFWISGWIHETYGPLSPFPHSAGLWELWLEEKYSCVQSLASSFQGFCCWYWTMYYSHLCQTGAAPPGLAKAPAPHMITDATAPPPFPVPHFLLCSQRYVVFHWKAPRDYSNKHYINNKWNAIQSESSWTPNFGFLPKAGRFRQAKAASLTSRLSLLPSLRTRFTCLLEVLCACLEVKGYWWSSISRVHGGCVQCEATLGVKYEE